MRLFGWCKRFLIKKKKMSLIYIGNVKHDTEFVICGVLQFLQLLTFTMFPLLICHETKSLYLIWT